MENDGIPLYPNGQQVYPSAQLPKNGELDQQSAACGQPITQIVPVKPLLGPDNTITVCQFCHASIKTAVKYTNTTRTHIAAALWGILCCLCCVMYGSDSAKNSDHYCPNCQRYLGTYEK